MHELDLELVSRAAAAMGVREAVVDPEMPVAVADRLRADGIVLRPDHDAIASQAAREVARPSWPGIRRAQAAAEAGMRAAADLLAPGRARRRGAAARRRAADGRDGARRAARGLPAQRRPGAAGRDRGSLWQGTGHDPGSGPLPADLPIVIDLWPRDEAVGVLGRHDPDVRRRRGHRRRARARVGSSARRSSGPARRCGRASPAASCTPSPARCSSRPGFPRSAPTPGDRPGRGLPVLARPRRRARRARGSGARSGRARPAGGRAT